MANQLQSEGNTPGAITLSGAPALDSDSFVQHTVGTSEVNELTAHIDSLLKSGVAFEEIYEEFAQYLAADKDGRFTAIFSRSVVHLTLVAEETLAKTDGAPEDEYLHYLICLGGFAFGSVSDRVFLDEIDPSTRVTLSRRYDDIGSTILERTLHSDNAATGAEAAFGFLTTVRILLNSNETSDFYVPFEQLYNSTTCVHIVLNAFVNDTCSETLGAEDLDALIQLAFDIAQSARNPELAAVLLQTYSFYQAEIDTLVSSSETDEQQDEQVFLEIEWRDEPEEMETPDMIPPDYEAIEAVKEMELLCLHAFSLCAATQADAEFLNDLLDARLEDREFSSALLGLARTNPRAAKPYIMHAIKKAAAADPIAAQGLLHLIETDTAYLQLMESFHESGVHTAREAVTTLHQYVDSFLEIEQDGMTEAGFDQAIPVSLSTQASDIIFVSVRQLTANRFEAFSADIDNFLDSEE